MLLPARRGAMCLLSAMLRAGAVDSARGVVLGRRLRTKDAESKEKEARYGCGCAVRCSAPHAHALPSVTFNKTPKRRVERKQQLVVDVKKAVNDYAHIWVVRHHGAGSNTMQELRRRWNCSR